MIDTNLLYFQYICAYLFIISYLCYYVNVDD